MDSKGAGRLDSVSLAGMAIFGALAVVLTTISQGLVLSFPLIPYLQFDLGEIAILLAFFLFGPVPALVASFIEFATLMVIGVNVAFYGPELKLIAIVSSLLGIWLGTVLVARLRKGTVTRAIGLGGTLGMLIRAAVMTLPNYIIIIYLYTVPGIVGYVKAPLKLVGINITDTNALLVVLSLTAVFNILQFGFVSLVTYFVMGWPQVQSTKVAGRSPWVVSYFQAHG